ncbi:transcription factor Ouib [Drosophila subpulchrella]|uniref:transcription factor Ouib n=1 Tax=Drosophila subpulchrella TaxID=1486046 RepID=UPI0018A14AF3|nr:transcription factor Ouib [Drosophila subpulchrella]
MLNNVCRVCGRQKICEKSLNLFDVVNRKYLKHLHMITGLRLCPLDNAPGFMCLCCQSELRSALAFRRVCIKTQQKWLTIEADSSADPKLESEKNATVSNFREPDDGEVLEETFQILIEEEPSDSVLIPESEEFEKLDFETDCCSTNEEIDKASVPHQKILRISSKPKTDDQIYTCELCGTYAASKSIFQRHMRKHTGVRPFGCKECGARFLTAAELRSHHRVHSKEQPFACRFCEKRYVSYMGRMTHERIHTNERPYVCEKCGMKFTTAYVLKNHMVIHTGERNFRCETCNRSFQRRGHLKTHFESMMHQIKIKRTEEQSLLKRRD